MGLVITPLVVVCPSWSSWGLHQHILYQSHTCKVCKWRSMKYDFVGCHMLSFRKNLFNLDVSENGGFSSQIIHFLIWFSIIFTIHFGVSLFLETPICRSRSFFECMSPAIFVTLDTPLKTNMSPEKIVVGRWIFLGMVPFFGWHVNFQSGMFKKVQLVQSR